MSKNLPALLAPLVFALVTPSLAAERPADGQVTVGPDYKIDPAATDLGAPRGRVFQFATKLADSKIYDGDDPTLVPNKPVQTERVITVYVPAAYRNGDRAPVLVMFDGPGKTRGTGYNHITHTGPDDTFEQMTRAMDNLIGARDPNRRLPVFVVVAVQNGGSDARGSQRGLEYDTLSDRTARFVSEEVLPAVIAEPQIKAAYSRFALTRNPDERATLGCSSAGAAAFTAAWFRPDLFRRVIAYSATLVDQQNNNTAEDAAYPLGAWEYHTGMKLIAASPKKPLRIFHQVSENDLGANAPEESHRNWVIASRRTDEALAAKGYPYRSVFAKGAGHCDPAPIGATIADTLVWTWKGVR
jgi:enterochelin esterase family protein